MRGGIERGGCRLIRECGEVSEAQRPRAVERQGDPEGVLGSESAARRIGDQILPAVGLFSGRVRAFLIAAEIAPHNKRRGAALGKRKAEADKGIFVEVDHIHHRVDAEAVRSHVLVGVGPSFETDSVDVVAPQGVVEHKAVLVLGEVRDGLVLHDADSLVRGAERGARVIEIPGVHEDVVAVRGFVVGSYRVSDGEILHHLVKARHDGRRLRPGQFALRVEGAVVVALDDAEDAHIVHVGHRVFRNFLLVGEK